MRSAGEFDKVQRLTASGMNDCAIAQITGVPRRTVSDWRRGMRSKTPRDLCRTHDFTVLPSASYAYLLGLYLGDGYISRNRRVWHLRITLDRKYPGIIESCRAAINAVMRDQQAGIYTRKSGCVDVYLCSKHWPCLFPQHGPGRKHLRPIVLEPWQQDHVAAATEDFIRGLIHSDGCRVVANDRGVASVRYHFTNHSTDIRTLYCAALDSLGIPWTQNSRYVIAVYRKAAIARLDQFVGPKA